MCDGAGFTANYPFISRNFGKGYPDILRWNRRKFPAYDIRDLGCDLRFFLFVLPREETYVDVRNSELLSILSV